MAFFQPFALDPRRRLLAEEALGAGGAMTPPLNPDAPAPVRLPDLPVGPAPTPRPRILGIPGGMPGAEASPLPETATPSALPLPARGAPGALSAPPSPPPSFEPPSRSTRLAAEKEGFMRGTPGRFKSAILSGLQGFAGGMASGGGLAAGLGGLAAGAGFGAIDPRGAREREFEQRAKPKILEGFAMEDAETAARMAAAKTAAERALQQVQITNMQDQIRSRNEADALNREKFGAEQNRLIPAPPGTTFLDPKTKQPVFTATDPRQGNMTPDQAEAALTTEEGTVEEISQGSLQGRMESLKQRLTPEEQRLNFGGATSNDSSQAIARAQAKWQKIQDDELYAIRRDTGERRKAKITQKRFGRKGTPGRTAISVREAADLLR